MTRESGSNSKPLGHEPSTVPQSTRLLRQRGCGQQENTNKEIHQTKRHYFSKTVHYGIIKKYMNLEWEDRNYDKWIIPNDLRFADDIVLMIGSTDELQQIIFFNYTRWGKMWVWKIKPWRRLGWWNFILDNEMKLDEIIQCVQNTYTTFKKRQSIFFINKFYYKISIMCLMFKSFDETNAKFFLTHRLLTWCMGKVSSQWVESQNLRILIVWFIYLKLSTIERKRT